MTSFLRKYCRSRREIYYFWFYRLPWKLKNTILPQQETYPVLFLRSLFGQSTMWKEKESFQVAFWTYIYTLALFCSLFFPLHHHHHHPSCLPVETTIERRGRSETTYIIKQIFRFSFFSHSLCWTISARIHLTHTYCRSLSRWPQNKNEHYVCAIFSINDRNKT